MLIYVQVKKSCVIITVDDEMDRYGYGETGGARMLKDSGKNIKHADGIHLSAMVVKDNVSAVWSPIAERVDSINRVRLNGFCMETEDEQEKFQIWIRRLMNGELSPQTELFNKGMESKETAESRLGGIDRQIVVAEEVVVNVENVCSEKIEKAEKSLD